MRATFDGTVAILVKAYLNDTLYPMSCAACAVGNLVAAGCGYEVVSGNGSYFNENTNPIIPAWANVIKSQDEIYLRHYIGPAKREIDSTGYTPEQLGMIEHVFMMKSLPPGASYSDPDNFSGLMAVVDYLAEIHGISLESKESAKALFVKA